MADLPQEYIQDAPAKAIPTIIGSIGCFLKKGVLAPLKADAKDKFKVTGWTINPAYQHGTVYDGVVDVLVSTKDIPKASDAPKMSARCLFQKDLAVASSTGFWIHQDLIIATAGHCIFKDKVVGETTCQLKDDFKDWNFVFGLTQEYVNGKQVIPVEKVWGIDRAMFGQNEQFEDMTKSGKGLALDDVDCPDWALVRLKPLAGSQLPAKGPFPLADPATITDGLPGVYTFGHTWGTALKASVPQKPNYATVRTTIKAEEQTAKSGRWTVRPGRSAKDYPLVNIVRHNVRIGPGNSGSPLLLKDSVVGINASVRGSSLEQRLFTWNGAPGSQIEPYFPPLDDVSYYSNATKSDIWSSLITKNSQVFVIARVIDENLTSATANTAISISITLGFTGPAGQAKLALTTIGPASWDSKPYLIALPDGYLSCEVSSMTVTYTPPAAANPAVKNLVIIEHVQMFSKKAGDNNNLNWTVLLQAEKINKTMVDVQGSAKRDCAFTLPVQPWIPKEWAYNLAVGGISIGEVMPVKKS